jgi:hypothetical protein
MKAKSFWITLYCVFIVQAFFTLALAQDPVLPATDAQAIDIFGTLWNFIVTKQYAAAVGPVLTLLVWGLKKYDLTIFNALKLPKVATAVDTFLDKPFVSFLLPTVISAGAGFATALMTGHSVTEAFGAVWAASTTAITTYVGLKKAGEQLNAGKEAAAAVEAGGKPAAIDELKKP